MLRKCLDVQSTHSTLGKHATIKFLEAVVVTETVTGDKHTCNGGQRLEEEPNNYHLNVLKGQQLNKAHNSQLSTTKRMYHHYLGALSY